MNRDFAYYHDVFYQYLFTKAQKCEVVFYSVALVPVVKTDIVDDKNQHTVSMNNTTATDDGGYK